MIGLMRESGGSTLGRGLTTMRLVRRHAWGRMGGLRRRMRWLVRNQGGGLLVDTTVVLAVFGLLGTAVLGGVQTSYTAKRQFDIQSSAENLVRNQIESVFEQTYNPPGQTYLPTAAPTGYSVTAEAQVYDVTSNNIEVVQITVFHHGQQVKVFETIRANH